MPQFSPSQVRKWWLVRAESTPRRRCSCWSLGILVIGTKMSKFRQAVRMVEADGQIEPQDNTVVVVSCEQQKLHDDCKTMFTRYF